jgi:hypothetical protein
MVYSPLPPYEILQNKLLDFETVQRLRRFSRYWDLVANSGNFRETCPLLWLDSGSPFNAFLAWSDWLYTQTRQTHGIALVRLAEFLFTYLTQTIPLDPALAANHLWSDYQRAGRSDKPVFLRPYLSESDSAAPPSDRPRLPKRQARHLAIGPSGIGHP